ncbi:uncharacterized protein LACBIDRAFT_330709 [Laccaria bicolor S238N-H82]|uniref:Predicted protein n=1 Tax=Laccaria bicolor (strain S238N-H82 / ATCC MYA-4686) TaxID=486041 RepID=B0DM68_LACBS|nr:uncharacterized protein LACBIDRAFT_330709 [Laccaria bicolor S238N-H82]EDR04142.1 predicted protein [Laccaria bicolor S238N-H82]|eukprot:XP_001885033.1 predicted protein [Laccaria bicolor S238N-H82]
MDRKRPVLGGSVRFPQYLAITLQDVWLALAEEEAAQAALGNLPRHKVSLSAFLMSGFELEDSHGQTERLEDHSFIYPTSPPENGVQSASSSPETLPKNIPLYLPSSLPSHIRTLPELKEICQMEQRLREPQADDTLSEVRCQRRVIQGLWQFKQLNISRTGNRPNTKMITLYKQFSNKTDRAAEKYKSAWRALCALNLGGSWSMRLKELKTEHITGPRREPDDVSNSRYEPSWIWLVPHVSGAINMQMNIGKDEFNEVGFWDMHISRLQFAVAWQRETAVVDPGAVTEAEEVFIFDCEDFEGGAEHEFNENEGDGLDDDDDCLDFDD